METTFQSAFTLLIIGMVTVFLVLSLVVLSGWLLIKIVNSFPSKISRSSKYTLKDSAEISPSIIAAITASVHFVTDGKGIVSEIEKINKE